MLSKNMVNALNKQIEEEFYSANLYLAMASWCDKEGLNNCAEFLYSHFEEETSHGLKIFHYLNEMGSHAIVPKLKQPPKEYNSIQSVFKDTYKHELFITDRIHALVKIAIDEGDYRTNNFLQWFVEEQREEETTFQEILDKLKIIGNGPSSLHFIEQEIEKLSNKIHNNTDSGE
jgi:ferritin